MLSGIRHNTEYRGAVRFVAGHTQFLKTYLGGSVIRGGILQHPDGDALVLIDPLPGRVFAGQLYYGTYVPGFLGRTEQAVYPGVGRTAFLQSLQGVPAAVVEHLVRIPLEPLFGGILVLLSTLALRQHIGHLVL